MTWLDRLILEKAGAPVKVFDPTLETLCAGLPPEGAKRFSPSWERALAVQSGDRP